MSAGCVPPTTVAPIQNGVTMLDNIVNQISKNIQRKTNPNSITTIRSKKTKLMYENAQATNYAISSMHHTLRVAERRNMDIHSDDCNSEQVEIADTRFCGQLFGFFSQKLFLTWNYYLLDPVLGQRKKLTTLVVKFVVTYVSTWQFSTLLSFKLATFMNTTTQENSIIFSCTFNTLL